MTGWRHMQREWDFCWEEWLAQAMAAPAGRAMDTAAPVPATALALTPLCSHRPSRLPGSSCDLQVLATDAFCVRQTNTHSTSTRCTHSERLRREQRAHGCDDGASQPAHNYRVSLPQHACRHARGRPMGQGWSAGSQGLQAAGVELRNGLQAQHGSAGSRVQQEHRRAFALQLTKHHTPSTQVPLKKRTVDQHHVDGGAQALSLLAAD